MYSRRFQIYRTIPTIGSRGYFKPKYRAITVFKSGTFGLDRSSDLEFTCSGAVRLGSRAPIRSENDGTTKYVTMTYDNINQLIYDYVYRFGTRQLETTRLVDFENASYPKTMISSTFFSFFGSNIFSSKYRERIVDRCDRRFCNFKRPNTNAPCFDKHFDRNATSRRHCWGARLAATADRLESFLERPVCRPPTSAPSPPASRARETRREPGPSRPTVPLTHFRLTSRLAWERTTYSLFTPSPSPPPSRSYALFFRRMWPRRRRASFPSGGF